MTPLTSVLLFVGLLILFFSRISLNVLDISNPIGDSDAFGHLIQIRDIRNAGHRRPERPSPVLTQGVYSYPYFVHWVLSFLPERYLLVVVRYFSGIMDILLFAVLLLLYLTNVLTETGLILGLALLIATPEFMRPDLAHGRGFSARKPGLILCSTSLISLILWGNNWGQAWLAAAVFVGSFVFLSSKFGMQAYMFSLVGIGFVFPIGATVTAIGALVLAIVISRGRYIRILFGHLSHLRDYASTKQYKMFDHSLPNPRNFILCASNVRSLSDLIQFIYDNRLFRTLLSNPFVVAVGGFYIYSYTMSITTAPVPAGLTAWIAAGVIAFVLTSLPHLLFLGQPERYLEYVFVPSILVVAIGVNEFGAPYHVLVGCVITGGLAVVAANIWIFTNSSMIENTERNHSFKHVLEFLSEQDPGIVLVEPVWRAKHIAWETPHNVVTHVGNQGTTQASVKEMNKLFPKKYGHLTDDWEWLRSQYDPDFIVYDIEKIKERDSELGLPLPDEKPAFENGNFHVYNYPEINEN